MKKKFISILSLILIINLFSLACLGTSATEIASPADAEEETGAATAPEETETTAAAEDTEEEPDATEATEEPIAEPTQEEQYLGDTAQSGGYGLTVLEIINPAEGGQLADVESGNKLVALDVIVTNIDGEPLSVNPLNFTLVDDEGFTYETALGEIQHQILTVMVSSGEQVRGMVGFEVPEETDSFTSLKFSTSLLGGDGLQSSLAPTPEGHEPNRVEVSPTAPDTGLGEKAEQSGLTLSAVAVEDPTDAGMLYEEREGYRLVAVEMIIGNESGDSTLTVNPLNAYLVDQHGYVYGAELGGRSSGQISTGDLASGEKKQGWVSFDVQEGHEPLYIKYQAELFTNNFIKTRVTE